MSDKTASEIIEDAIEQATREYMEECGYENIDERWEDYSGDEREEFRCSGELTVIAPDDQGLSRYYESQVVARVMPCGTAVAWVYFSGGGKHGEPGAIGWIEHAFIVDCTKVVRTVNVFTRPTPGGDQ